MKRIIILCIFVILVSHSVVYAKFKDNKPPSYEELYTEWGYTTIDDAITQFENSYNKDLKLPLRVPPIAFTHHFGKFTDSEGNTNSFSAQFVNDKHPEKHYKIDVKAAEDGMEFNERQVIDTYKLKNGTIASYISLSQHQIGFYALVFTKNGWQYILSIDERVADTVTPEVLVKIANSFEDE
ncbi:hypothetical protein [Virgibacillus halodenitrificans]|uniref:DUF4367 domain-containing protein n=1 Tax=Virgibacillus halodenitrificans TaxID=1482 RepID=A0ABR7VM67_VIRHA|nr:hypothetical protein [Virgibacillus halodenitrificans]MBD1221898.1 hypothetical protein [Virgibacillus halodenitrificans]